MTNGMRVQLKSGICILVIMLVTSVNVSATMENVQEQTPKYKYTTRPSEKLVMEKSPSAGKLVSNTTAGVIQGVDSNPLLDPSHKIDSYTEETADMHFKYPLLDTKYGTTNARFGFNVTNVNYYRQTDVNIMDSVADFAVEHKLSDNVTVTPGYAMDILWFPHDENGTFIGNEFNVSVKHKINKMIYQKGTYRILIKNYFHRKARMGNEMNASQLRHDLRNAFEHEVGIYLTNITKVRIINQVYLNNSNDTYWDYYNYTNYKVGTSVTQFLTKKLYTVSGFYYQRRNYESRRTSDNGPRERDNLYLVTTSFLYDISRDMSIFVNYSHTENHTNAPLQKYADNLYSAGLYYSF